ncbi:MAG: ferric reductase-like transmembrane domain-containing protein [Cyanobacteria bacterium J06642_11]
MADYPLRVLKSKYFLWFLLAIPAWEYIYEFVWPDRYYPEMMENSGILSIQLLVLTLCITPLTLLLKRITKFNKLSLWLLKSRRYFGLAAFAYAAIHTLLYLRYLSWDWHLIWLEALQWNFGTGWIAMIGMLIGAATSNSYMVSKLGKNWKRIQRVSYIVAVGAFAHWLLLDFFIDNAMQWIVPLVIAKIFHLLLRYFRDGQLKVISEKSLTG